MNNAAAADKSDSFFKTQLEETPGDSTINEPERKLLPLIEKSPVQSLSKGDLRMMALKKSKRGIAKQRSENTSPQMRKRAPSEEKERNRYEKVKALSEKFKLTNKQIYELEAEYNSLVEIGKQGTENEMDFLKDKGAAMQGKKTSTNNAMKAQEKDNAQDNLPLKVYLK